MKNIIYPTLFLTAVFSSNVFAGTKLNTCQVKILPQNSMAHLDLAHKSVNNLLGKMTVRYQIDCTNNQPHKVLVSSNQYQYANKANTFFDSKSRNLTLSLISSSANTQITDSGIYVETKAKNSIVSNTFNIFLAKPLRAINFQSGNWQNANFTPSNDGDFHPNGSYEVEALLQPQPVTWYKPNGRGVNVVYKENWCRIWTSPNNVHYGRINTKQIGTPYTNQNLNVWIRCRFSAKRSQYIPNPNNLVRVKFSGKTYQNSDILMASPSNSNLGLKLSMKLSHKAYQDDTGEQNMPNFMNTFVPLTYKLVAFHPNFKDGNVMPDGQQKDSIYSSQDQSPSSLPGLEGSGDGNDFNYSYMFRQKYDFDVQLVKLNPSLSVPAGKFNAVMNVLVQ